MEPVFIRLDCEQKRVNDVMRQLGLTCTFRASCYNTHLSWAQSSYQRLVDSSGVGRCQKVCVCVCGGGGGGGHKIIN